MNIPAGSEEDEMGLGGALLVRVAAVVVVLLALIAAPAAATGGSSDRDSDCDSSFVTRRGQTWRLSPSGGDDTANVQCALGEAAASGERALVRLGNGTFRIGFVEVEGFYGVMRGAGTTETIVEVLGGLDCTGQFAARGSVDLLGFAQSTVDIRQITFQGFGPSCAEPWQTLPADGPAPPLVRSDVEALVALRPGLGRTCSDETSYGDLSVRDSAFLSAEPDFDAPTFAPDSVQHGVVFGQDSLVGPPPDCLAPALSGRLVVKDSRFVELGTGIDPSNLVDSNVTVAGNHFSNVDLSVFGEDNYGSRVVIKGNDIDGPSRPEIFSPVGVLIVNGCSGPNPRAALTTLVIRDNEILMRDGMTGIVAADCVHGEGGDPTLRVHVVRNHFESDNGFAGVDIPFGEDGRVSRNRFSGTAFGGIGLVVNNSGFNIVDNDFADYVTDGPDILLGPETSDNRVVVSADDVVDDQGTNNRIIVR